MSLQGRPWQRVLLTVPVLIQNKQVFPPSFFFFPNIRERGRGNTGTSFGSLLLSWLSVRHPSPLLVKSLEKCQPPFLVLIVMLSSSQSSSETSTLSTPIPASLFPSTQQLLLLSSNPWPVVGIRAGKLILLLSKPL